MGIGINETPIEKDWSEVVLPTSNIQREVKNLLTLFAQYTVYADYRGNEEARPRLIITPGYTDKSSLFEIDVFEQRKKLLLPKEYKIKVYLDNDQIVFMGDNDINIGKDSWVSRNDDGSIDSINICIGDLDSPVEEPYYKFIAQTKLLLAENEEEKIVVPKRGSKNEKRSIFIDVVNDSGSIYSIDKNRWITLPPNTDENDDPTMP